MGSFLNSLAQDDEALARFLDQGAERITHIDKENHPRIAQSVSEFDINVAQLNSDLASLGISSEIVVPGDQIYAEKAFILAIDTVTALLKSHKASVARCDQISERLRRTQQDCENSSKQIAQLNASLKKNESQIAALKSKLISDSNSESETRTKLQREILSLRSQLLPIQQREQHAILELRRKNKELERLTTQLNSVLFDKRAAVRPSARGIQISEALSADTSNGSAAEKYCNMISSVYEHRQNELLAENEELRQAVHDAQHALRSAVEKECENDDDGVELSTPQSEYRRTPNTPRMALLPMSMLRSDVRISMQNKLERLAARTGITQQNVIRIERQLQMSDDSSHSSKTEDVSVLKETLEQYKLLVAQQEQVIKMAVPGFSVSSETNHSERTIGRSPHLNLEQEGGAVDTQSSDAGGVKSGKNVRVVVPLCTPDVRATLCSQMDAQAIEDHQAADTRVVHDISQLHPLDHHFSEDHN
uniref:Uncharacterized protein n=1 Tax=Timspurckia oligopyrenoides TaxID=708627 RepID=A0A7S1ES61_9RHOD|mmetsp:Transcript_4336/g.7608  ORF Transcript_4336/g.7608 Transcript_4336/m.7608 type:complete len:478 (+) Transcript_4336:155-1588(+)